MNQRIAFKIVPQLEENDTTQIYPPNIFFVYRSISSFFICWQLIEFKSIEMVTRLNTNAIVCAVKMVSMLIFFCRNER